MFCNGPTCLPNPMQVVSHLEKKFSELDSPNKLKVYLGHGAKAWVSDFNHPHYMAGRKAMKTGRERCSPGLTSWWWDLQPLISVDWLSI